MNLLMKNAETSKRRKRLALHYQETKQMEQANQPYNWSEIELDSLWIGVRRYGQSNWEAMLNDPMLKFSYFRTPASLAERWLMERQRIQLDSFQTPCTNSRENQLVIQTRVEAAISSGFMKIQMKEEPSSSNPPAAVSHRSKRKVALIGHAKFRRLVVIEPSQDQDNMTGTGNSIDLGKTDSEISLKEWIKGTEPSSEGTVSG